jgi:hypothetical protein
LPLNLNSATEIEPSQLDDIFEYHAWDENKIIKGRIVRKVLAEAFAQIIENVPPCADRSVALRKLREARMDCNSAITHDGKY